MKLRIIALMHYQIWYVLREAMKTYHATTCHPDRFHMIPGILDAKEVKIIVIINNVSITIEKENQKYKTKTVKI